MFHVEHGDPSGGPFFCPENDKTPRKKFPGPLVDPFPLGYIPGVQRSSLTQTGETS